MSQTRSNNTSKGKQSKRGGSRVEGKRVIDTTLEEFLDRNIDKWNW
jgi:hypothetical protein